MTLADEINRMIKSILESSTWTSAGGSNPVENFIKEFRGAESPDLERDFAGGSGGNDVTESAGKQSELTKLKGQVNKIKEGNVDELTKLSTQQFDNLAGIAQNPVNAIGKNFMKFAKVAGPIAIAAALWETVMFIVTESLKSGRLLDRKFKRDIKNEILAFRRREEKQKLKQGFARIIVTSMPRLRGGQHQVYDNFREIAAGRPVFTNDTFMISSPSGSPNKRGTKGKNVFGVGGRR
jgi:hypothetical protein